MFPSKEAFKKIFVLLPRSEDVRVSEMTASAQGSVRVMSACAAPPVAWWLQSWPLFFVACWGLCRPWPATPTGSVAVQSAGDPK